MPESRRSRTQLVWWIAAALLYPALLAAGLSATNLVMQLADSAGWSALPADSITLVVPVAVFGVASFLAAKGGAPQRLWLVPAAGLALYACVGLATWRPPRPVESADPRGVILFIAGYLLMALAGTAAGEWLGGRRTKTSHAEQALQPDSAPTEVDSGTEA